MPWAQNFAFTASTAASSGEPAPVATPVATAQVAEPVASAIDAVVELRVEIRPDASVGSMPLMTVYSDGTVLRRDGHRRPDHPTQRIWGLERVLTEARNSGLFAKSGELGSDPTYQGGVTMYAIELRQDAAVVRRETSNSMAPAGPGRRPNGSSPSPNTWTTIRVRGYRRMPGDPTVAEPDDVCIELHPQGHVVQASSTSAYPPEPMDVTDVQWPLPGSLEGFGEFPIDQQPLGPGTSSRCGPLTLAEATAVQRALAAAPWVSMGDRQQAELGSDVGHVTVSLIPLLPDDPLDCEVDLSWP